MEGQLALGLGVSVISYFLRYAVKDMPPILAWSGVVAGILAAISAFLEPGMRPPISSVILLIVGVVCFGAALHLYLGRPASAQNNAGRFDVSQATAPNTQGPIIDQSVRSYNQQGGITAHSVTIAPPARNLDAPEHQALKQQMLSQLPKDKEITVMALMGDTDGINFAWQIVAFLKSNGFKTQDGIAQGVFTGPVKGLNFNPSTNTFLVGAR